MNSTNKQLVQGVFYTAVAKYASLAVSLVVTGILARMPTLSPDDFAVIAIAMIVIAFFGIFSDLGIAPAIVQYRDLSRDDLSNIFSFTVWTGAVFAGLFFGASGWIAGYYDSPVLAGMCQWLALNLFFATVNIVPNALLFRDKRFLFIAVRTLVVQTACGAVAVLVALHGAGIHALLVAPIGSSVLLFAINFREYPQRLRLTWGLVSVRKIFSFSAFQFLFNVINYFSRNLDKLLIGRYMNMTLLGFYEKSYRLMMLPLQNITYVISPVMHPIFADFQNDLRKLSDSYLKVVRFLAFVGFPLSVLLFFGAREAVLIAFGPRWELSVPVFRILALSVGVQIILSTSGSIFQAAGATRTMFLSGLLSAVLNVAGIALGIFGFRSLEAVAWCICITFTLNFVQCYYLMYYRTFRFSWAPLWRTLVSPLALSGAIAGALYFSDGLFARLPLVPSLVLKGVVALILWVAYLQVTREYDLTGWLRRKLQSRKMNPKN